MGCSNRWCRPAMPLALGVLSPALLMMLLAGCGGSQNEVLGTGPASLVFTNSGDTQVDVKVSWQGEQGQWQARDFTVYVDGRVELRVPQRDKFYINLDSECDCDTLAVASSGRAVPSPLVLEGGAPAKPPPGASLSAEPCYPQARVCPSS